MIQGLHDLLRGHAAQVVRTDVEAFQHAGPSLASVVVPGGKAEEGGDFLDAIEGEASRWALAHLVVAQV
jgi:hypothetical protein